MKSKKSRWSSALAALLTASLGCGGSGEAPAPSASAKPASAAPAIFRDATAELGLDFEHEQGKILWYLPQVTGAGVSLVDYDGDGQLDAYFVQGSGPDEGKNPDAVKPGILYRNDHGRLSNIGAHAGVLPKGYGMSAAAWDYDNDGYQDLALTYYREPTRLFRNNGDGTFSEVSNKSGLADPALIWPSSLTAFDFDRDGFLDLYQGGYIKYLPEDWVPNPAVRDEGRGPSQVTLLPGHYPGLTSQLYKNDGAGRFADVAPAKGCTDPDGQALNVLAADFDQDGWQDLYVANDSHAKCVLYRNLGGTFQDASSGSYADEMRGSMGSALGDADLDGVPDMLVTHWLNATALYRGSPPSRTGTRRIRFVDRALHQGLMMDRPLVGWAVAFLDVDNDAFDDILQLHGHTSPPPKDPMCGRLERQPAYLFRNQRDGFFERVAPGGDADPLSRERVGRAGAFGDLDRDGTVDLLLTCNNGPAEAWVNRGAAGAWIGLELTGAGGNRDAVGARVEIVSGDLKRWREVTAGESYMATNARARLFGLGARSGNVDATVRWPSGRVERFTGLAPRRYHRLVESGGS